MKLAILSKYRIHRAVRHQLPVMPQDIFSRQFYFKRALLEARLPVEGGAELVVVDTHFDAWTGGADTSERQAQASAALLAQIDRQGWTWCLGGDFNILPPGPAYSRLPAAEQAEHTLAVLTKIPTEEASRALRAAGIDPKRSRWGSLAEDIRIPTSPALAPCVRATSALGQGCARAGRGVPQGGRFPGYRRPEWSAAKANRGPGRTGDRPPRPVGCG